MENEQLKLKYKNDQFNGPNSHGVNFSIFWSDLVLSKSTELGNFTVWKMSFSIWSDLVLSAITKVGIHFYCRENEQKALRYK